MAVSAERQSLDRRHFLGAMAATLPILAATRSAEAAPLTFIALGDSYTASMRYNVPSWADQIAQSGAAKLIVNLAVSGATSTGSGLQKTFDGQVDRWISTYKAQGIPDRTVVYLGHNDNLKDPTARSNTKNAYRAQVDRLIAHGVTQGSRRLVLCLIHNLSRNPIVTTNLRPAVSDWNSFIRSLSSSRPNVFTVNIFSKIENVFMYPSKYGITNLTTPDKVRSATTHLYFDGDARNHPGRGAFPLVGVSSTHADTRA